MSLLRTPGLIWKPVPSLGVMKPTVLVIHRAENPPSDGAGLAAYNYYGSSAHYRWHRSIGSGGQRYGGLDWNQMGAHSAGLNSFAAGIEGDGRAHVDPWPDVQIRGYAIEAADFCHYIKREPSRDFIIGHVEDWKYGGTSSHTNPGPYFPWTKFMDYTWEQYDGDEEDDMGGLADRITFNGMVGKATKLKAKGFLPSTLAVPATIDELLADENKPAAEQKYRGLANKVAQAEVEAASA